MCLTRLDLKEKLLQQLVCGQGKVGGVVEWTLMVVVATILCQASRSHLEFFHHVEPI